ncbi:MAG: chromosome segregation protein SMC [Clostridiaceae bacterium]|jgi:chromosome segregation protein|nr:chromosome segregation protein SMC [Clostridiaceae bacterium]
MLKSLEIQGFKSFPEYTKIDFHKGITAIVGPNGAGKSNITDAIRWVLGEQSAKMLRGQRMEDVIFDGTAQRRPVSFSEVTLTLDNSGRILPIDYETVSITRRYYRSGDSEYLINKTLCRLKDINSLLMDTAVGLDGYSIIGQGRVDDILSNKSEDRRAIFEEASGIVQFRSRKDEALRKLDRSEQNLIRVDDLLAELQDQAVVLEKQAGDARSHIELATRFRQLDTALTLRQLETLEDQKTKKEGDTALLEADLETARKNQAGQRALQESAISTINRLDDQIEEEQGRFNQLSVKETEHIGLEALYKEQYAGSKQGAESLLEEKNRLIMQVMAAEQDLGGRALRRKELLNQQESLTAQVQAEKTLLDSLEQQVETYSNNLSAVSTRREELLSQLSDSRASLQALVGETQALESRLSRLTEDKEALDQEEKSSDQSLQAIRHQLSLRTQSIHDQEAAAAAARENTRSGHLKADQVEDSIDRLDASIRQLLYEADTLERLEMDFEGYSQPVRHIMQERSKHEDKGLFGPLGSLLTVPESLQLAIDVALGGSAHHLVCDQQKTAEYWIEWLRRTRRGRATFLPVDSLYISQVDQESLRIARQNPGWIGVASEMVDCDQEILPAARYALGRTLLVESLEEAVELSRQINRRYTVVTRSGDQVHRGGSMTGGYRAGKSTGVLGRPGRIQAARHEARGKSEEKESLLAALDSAKEELGRLAAEEERILEELAASKRELVRFKTEEEAGQSARHRLQVQIDRLLAEESQLKQRMLELDSVMNRLRPEIQEMDQERLKLEADLALLRADHESETDKYLQCKNQVTKLDLSIAAISDTLKEFDAVTARTGQGIESARVRLTSVEREWESQSAKMEEARHKTEDNKKILEEIGSAILDCKAGLEALMVQRDQAFSDQRSMMGSLDQANDQVTQLQSVLERRRAETQRSQQQIDDLLNRLWESHGMTRGEAKKESIDIPSVSKATSERAALKNQIDQLGPINHNAIRDYEALEARIDFTRTQRQDIEQARAELETLVGRLDQSMREQFSETIHEVNQNFNQVFSELFSGGQAEIVLEGETDVLLADIGIRARPPGKKLQKLSLLSGGERCLTAIALLFAILKLKPAPFCVFDEVESALDDANVKRFTDYVRRYAWSMQFILVTHRKGTMEAADRLYGVTMQERGISRVVSMVLSSALPYGE